MMRAVRSHVVRVAVFPVLALLVGGGACGSGGGGGGPAAAVASRLAIDDPALRPGSAPGEVLLRFTAPGEEAAVDAYDVRAQVRQVDPAHGEAATPATTHYAVQPPGAEQEVRVSGLEPGRTLQVTVRARGGATWGPFSVGVACRVPSAGAPALPPGAVALSGPAVLSEDGATYYLTADVTTPGTAFQITGHGVTLDLRGHTVTYGSGAADSYGVLAQWIGDSGLTTVRGGVVRQSGTQPRCHGVRVRGAHDVRLTALDVTAAGPDANAIQVDDYLTGSLRVDHCTLRSTTTVVTNRHYPGVAALWVEGAHGAVEVDSNLVLASPQWGILVADERSDGPFLIHHNRVVGTHAYVANGYMIGVHKPGADVFENDLHGESRGIHLDGIDGHGDDAWVHDNRVRAQDQPNPEFPLHWCHGIKLEGAERCVVERNRVQVVADATHSEAIAFDVSLLGTQGNVVRGNVFEGTSRVADKLSEAVRWTDGASGPSAGLVVERNVFRATDRFVVRAWDSHYGVGFAHNVYERDMSKGAGAAFVFEQFETSDADPSSGHGFEDPLSSVSPTEVGQLGTPGSYLSERRATLTADVRRADGVAVAGAVVRARDRQGALVASTSTGADGRAQLHLVTHRIRNGPTVDARGPFAVEVVRGGVGAWTGTVDPAGPTHLRVELAATSSATLDSTPPEAPEDVLVLPLSASRALVRWTPSTSDDVAGYLVRVDGVTGAVCDGPSCLVAGLEPGAPHAFSVVAIDAGGQLSAATPPTTAAQPAEDRGP